MCRWAAWEWRGFAYLGCVMVLLDGIECRAFLTPSPPPPVPMPLPHVETLFRLFHGIVFVSHNTVLRCENLGA